MREPTSAQVSEPDQWRFLSPWWVLAILGFGLATFTQADPDLWGHIRFGLDTLQTGHIASEDPYSFTQDRPWHNHEWLSEVVMAMAWRAGGVTGLVILKAALVTAAGAVVWGATRGAAPFIRVGTLVWLMFGAVHMTATLRPQLWSFLGCAIIARQLLTPSRLTYVALPATLMIWANMHGGWILGLGLVGLWIATGGVVEPGQRARALGVAVLCAVSTGITPYGFGTWEFILTTVRYERSIQEWRPLWEGDRLFQWIAWGGTTVAVTLWALGRNRHWPRLIVLLFLAVSALRVMRIGSLYVTVACVFLAPWLATRWRARVLYFSNVRLAAALMFLPLVAASVAAVRLGAGASNCIPSTGRWRADAAVLSTLEAAPPGRLLTTFDWGQYAIWHLGPAIKVSIDGRRETVYSAEHLARHDAVVSATDDGLKTLDEWRPDYVWLPQENRDLMVPLRERGYEVTMETPRSWLMSRAPIAAFTGSDSRAACFPR